MRLILLATRSLAADSLRVGLLTSPLVERVSLAIDVPHLLHVLAEGADCLVVDESLALEFALELEKTFTAYPTIRVGLTRSAEGSTSIDPKAKSHDTVSELLLAIACLTKHARAAPDFQRLSRRETQVVGYLASGMTNREIAELLKISIKTVDTHRGQILKKLGLRNNSDLTRFAMRHGLVPQSGATPAQPAIS